MFKGNNYEEILKFNAPLFIDLRSNKEYMDGTIPCAISMPILDDEERKVVGTLYDSGKIDEAKLKGVEYVTPKLLKYYKFITENAKDREVVLFCSRGGFRSTVLFNLLKSLGEKVYKLNFGYKAYRRYVLDYLNGLSRYEYVVLNGYTGCGKTEILNELKALGENVLDLEKLASSRGSIFGGVGLLSQPSQKEFESRIVEEFKKFKKGPIYIEAESSKIGKLIVPRELNMAYKNSKHQILITSTLEDRVARIKKDYLNDYGKERKMELLDAFESLKRYISPKRYENYLSLLEEEKFDEIIIDLIEKYYDLNYVVAKKDFEREVLNIDSRQTALELIKK